MTVILKNKSNTSGSADNNKVSEDQVLPSVIRAFPNYQNSLIIANGIVADGANKLVELIDTEVIYSGHEKGHIVSSVVFEDVKERNTQFSLHHVTPIAGTAIFDLSLAVKFVLNHNSNCNIRFTNVPDSGHLCVVSIVRKKDQSLNPRRIIFDDYTNIINIPDFLTQTSGAIDIITLRTVDGGANWTAGIVYNLLEAGK